jgi:hypothetical protein
MSKFLSNSMLYSVPNDVLVLYVPNNAWKRPGRWPGFRSYEILYGRKSDVVPSVWLLPSSPNLLFFFVLPTRPEVKLIETCFWSYTKHKIRASTWISKHSNYINVKAQQLWCDICSEIDAGHMSHKRVFHMFYIKLELIKFDSRAPYVFWSRQYCALVPKPRTACCW